MKQLLFSFCLLSASAGALAQDTLPVRHRYEVAVGIGPSVNTAFRYDGRKSHVSSKPIVTPSFTAHVLRRVSRRVSVGLRFEATQWGTEGYSVGSEDFSGHSVLVGRYVVMLGKPALSLAPSVRLAFGKRKNQFLADAHAGFAYCFEPDRAKPASGGELYSNQGHGVVGGASLGYKRLLSDRYALNVLATAQYISIRIPECSYTMSCWVFPVTVGLSRRFR